MKLSVIIPTFNRVMILRYRLEAYLSVLRKCSGAHGLSFEIIVVDDASTDGTTLSLETAFSRDPEVKVVALRENVGPGCARNKGLEVAQGDWIWFLDDDDSLNCEGVSRVFPYFHEEFDLIAHSLRLSYAPEKGVEARKQLARNVLLFHEKQEVFNYVFRASHLANFEIQFSEGLHEDIRYVIEALACTDKVIITEECLVLKSQTDHAITSHMYGDRIRGYLQAYSEISGLIGAGRVNFLENDDDLLAQTLGVILNLISRESDESALDLLIELKNSAADLMGSNLLAHYGPSDSNFRFASGLWSRAHGMNGGELLRLLRGVFSTRLSCKDLNSSLFLGPGEIRGCCKRFFVDGKQKGDVILLQSEAGITLEAIQAAKNDLIDRINCDRAPECSKCPYLERFSVDQLSVTSVDYISMENFSYCNMRCTYCSPKYYGGAEAKYNAAEILTQLAELDRGFSENCHVVWGGGEPTLSPHFSKVNNIFENANEVKKIRILSNGLRHSKPLERILKNPKSQLVTSIDAGTQEIFQKIRGKGEIDVVIENLVKYTEVLDDPERLTIKYIMTSENYSSDELKAFTSKVAEAGLMDCMFQISCDFRVESAYSGMVVAMYELAVRLYMADAALVFFDDLIRDRVNMDRELAIKVLDNIHKHKLNTGFIAQPDFSGTLVLWGVGLQSEWYLKKTLCGRSGIIKAVISDETELLRQEMPISAADLWILPSAVQSTYEIVKNISSAGLRNRIARFVLI